MSAYIASANGLPAVGSLQDLENTLRQTMTANQVIYSHLEKELNVSDTYLRQFHKEGRDVCINIMNRLANRFNIHYEISNSDHFDQDKPFDALSIEALRDQIRDVVKTAGIREAARRSGISHTWISKFCNAKVEICFKRLHKLANTFGIKYKFANFTDQSIAIQ